MGWVMKMDKEKEFPKRKPTRLKNFDYSSAGAYFVTICIKDRKRILSDIIKPVGVGAFDDPLTPFGYYQTGRGRRPRRPVNTANTINGNW